MSVTKVVLAKLSPTMEEGTIVKWTKKEGDPVKQGDVLAEIETDKANMEMEALGGGVLRKILIPAGGKAPVGALIGVIAEPGDDIAAMVASAATAVVAPSPTPATPPAPIVAVPVAASVSAPVPVAVAVAHADGARVKASPLARSIAAQRNISLAAVPGSGPGGRVIKRDVEAFAVAPRAAAPAAALAAATALKAAPLPSVTPGEHVPLSSMRKTIAKRLSESAFTAPHFYVTVEVDMDAAVALRQAILETEEAKVSFNDLIVKACAKGLRAFPMVNASWGNDAIVTHGDVHIGIAVSIPDGLITPVVRNADLKTVLEISHEVKDLAARARDKKLKPEEYMGSTFTISNLGMFDVTEFTAIINPPDSAILAVGSVRRVPVVDGDSIRVGHRMKVTLSSDHRVIDGALAAQFMQAVRKSLEKPLSLLL